MADPQLMEQLDRAIQSVLAGEPPDVRDHPELAPLAAIAIALRDLPSENFKDRLKTELQRRPTMTTSKAVAAGFRTVTPFLIHTRAAELVDFLKSTFHAEELKRSAEGSEFYSEVRIGDSVIVIAGTSSAQTGNLPSALHVYVDDCDATYRRALDSGAVRLGGEPTDQPYGERAASVRDAFGNYWYLATRFPSTPVPEGMSAVLPYLHPRGARQYIDFLARAFGAGEQEVFEGGGRVIHAKVRIGDAIVEMGEPHDHTGIPSNGMFFFVDDVEAAYARALAAGATLVRPPASFPAGMRSAIVRDSEGYFWWPAQQLG